MTQCPKCAAIVSLKVRACPVCKTRRTFERHWHTDMIRTMALSVDRCIRRGLRYSGRAPGYEFWYFWVLAVFFGAAIVRTLGHSMLDHIVAALLLGPMLLAAASVTIRRLHDAGKGAIVLILPPAFAAALWHFEFALAPRLVKSYPHTVVSTMEILLLLALGLTIVRTIYLLAKSSEPGNNQFGRRDPIP